MTDYLLAEEVKDFLIDLFHNDIWDWKTLTPIELGVLSWHLDNFYYFPLTWES